MDIQRDEEFEKAYSEICKPIIARPYPRNEKGEYIYKEIHEAHLMWQAKAQEVPEGFVLVPKLLSDELADELAIDAFNNIQSMFDYEHRGSTATHREEIRLRWCKNKARDFQENYKAMIEAQESSLELKYPNIFRAAKEIWYDNGMINQFEPIEQKIEQLSVWLKTLDANDLAEYNEKLDLTDDNLSEVCCGEETLAYEILPDEAVHDFLGRIFNEEYAAEAQEQKG